VLRDEGEVMVRGLIFGSIAFVATFALERQFGALTKDIERYDRMREMSGDPPLWRQQLGNLFGFLVRYGNDHRGEASGLALGLQSDLRRYIRISSM
jgi:hypothetical protein